MRYSLLVALILLSHSTFSESHYLEKLTEPSFGTWGVGIVNRSPNYAGADHSNSLAPFIFGGYGPIFIEANRFGYNFYRDGTWFASAIGQLRTQSARDEDKDSGLKERKTAFEMGGQVGRRLPLGFVARLAWLQDVSGVHKSHEWDLQFYRRDRIGALNLITTLALQYQNDSLVDYYYGQPGIYDKTDFKADPQLVQELELLFTYSLSEEISFFFGTRNYRYESSIEQSPIADGRNIIQSFAGVGYQF